MKAGADVNARDEGGNTPLHEIGLEAPEIFMALLKAGADLEARNKRGKNPQNQVRIFYGKTPVVMNALKRALERKRGQEEERRRRVKSCEKWNTEAFFEHVGVADVSRCLKTKNSNARNEQGETPLHKAVVYNKKLVVVTTLLRPELR